MQHQDFNTIIFNSGNNNTPKEKKKEGKTPLMSDNDTIKIESDKKLGQMLSQGRITKGFKTQQDFITELNKNKLNISIQVYSKWESNKSIPTNQQIAHLEKVLGIKLPRNKKIKIEY